MRPNASVDASVILVTRPKYPPVAIPLSHCVSCGIADYRCYTPTSFRKSGPLQSKDRPNKGGLSQKKLAPEAYRAKGASHEIVSRIALLWETKGFMDGLFLTLGNRKSGGKTQRAIKFCEGKTVSRVEGSESGIGLICAPSL